MALTRSGRQRFRAERVKMITAQAADAVVLTYDGSLTDEQRAKVITSVERSILPGGMPMVLTDGLKVARVVSVKDAPGESNNQQGSP